MAVLMTAWFFYATLWVLKSAILVDCRGKPTFRGTPKTKYSAHLGDSVKLRCPASGTAGSKATRTLVAWFKGGNVIQNQYFNWSRFSLFRNKHLNIKDIQEQDAGTYNCTAMNPSGSIELVIVLKVKSRKIVRGKPPKFKEKQKKKKVYKVGETAKLQCHSTGDPDPHVQWFKDGESYGVETRASVGADGWTLNLRYLEVSDSGIYTCRVSNNIGSIFRNFTVVVKARTLKPIIEEPDEKMRAVRRGHNVKFDCKVSSFGEVTFDWRWSQRNANSSVDLKEFGSKYIGNASRIYENSQNLFYYDGFLVVKNVEEEDEGRYSCLVKNSHGKDKMDFFLRVKKGSEERGGPGYLSTTQNSLRTSAPKGDEVETKKNEISVTLVAILTASIVVAMIFIVVLVMCCRKQRKDLEKQYVNEYQPQSLFQPYTEHSSIYQEMQKYAQNNPSGKAVKASAGSEKVPADEHASFPSSLNSCETRGESKTGRSVSSEMYLANSRTSLQTTLCRGCPRETSLDYKGRGEDSLSRKSGSVTGVSLPGRVVSPRVQTSGSDVEKRCWDSQSSLDDFPRKTSPQRSRESIV